MAQEDPKANWSKGRGVSRVLEHFKIIGARKLTKNDMDHANLNFRVFLALRDAKKYSLEHRNMEGNVILANLTILDPTAKTVHRSKIRFGRYRRAAPHRRDPRSDGQNTSLSTQKGRLKVR